MNGAFMSGRGLIDRETTFDNNSVRFKRWMIRTLSVDVRERLQECETYSFVCDKKSYPVIYLLFYGDANKGKRMKGKKEKPKDVNNFFHKLLNIFLKFLKFSHHRDAITEMSRIKSWHRFLCYFMNKLLFD